MKVENSDFDCYHWYHFNVINPYAIALFLVIVGHEETKNYSQYNLVFMRQEIINNNW